MPANKEQYLLEELSRAIDRLNAGRPAECHDCDRETKELLAVASLVKQTAPVKQPSAKWLRQTVDQVAAELSAARRKRRLAWLYSGVAGAVVAAAALVVFSLAPGVPQDGPQVLPPLEGTVVIEKVAQTPDAANSLADAAASGLPRQEPQLAETPRDLTSSVRPAASESSSPRTAKPDEATPRVAQEEVKSGQAPVNSAGGEEKIALFTLAGKAARTVAVDEVTGAVRQIFDSDRGEVIVTQRRIDAAQAASAGKGRQAAALTQKAVTAQPPANADERPAVARERSAEGQNSNQITIILHGREVTVEGRLPKEELLKIARSLVQE